MVYPADRDFIFRFFIYRLYFLSTFLRIQTKSKQIILTPRVWLNASTALGHVLMPSAQLWADSWCCRRIPQILHFLTPLTLLPFEVLWIPRSKMVGMFSIKCFRGNKTRLVCLSAYDFFILLVKISRLHITL